MTAGICCPVCDAEVLFSKRFGEHRLYRCTSCENIFYYPSPLAHGMDGTPWESAKWYAERGANLLFYAEVLAHIRSFVETPARKRKLGTIDMLEVGGSYGFLMDMASLLFGWNVTGVDPSPCAQQGSQALGRETVRSRVEDARFEKSFDVIVGVQLIEHIQEPGALMRSISHLVKEDGVVVLTTPDASVEDLGAEYSPGEHHILFSQKGLAPLLADAGLIHHKFFTTTVPTIMGVAAAKTPFAASTNPSATCSIPATPKQLALDYLTEKTRRGPHAGSLGIGLSFRLFELLVNEGRYAEADAHVRTLETLMGMGGHESYDSFTVRMVNPLAAAKTALDYVTAGPGCFAPYLFYKGILNLNHRRDRVAAGACFTYASRLLEHEVQGLSLVQYAPLLKTAREHMKMTGVRIDSDADDIHKETRKLEAAPFIRGGIAEFCRSVPLGRLCRLGIRGGNSFIFTFASMEDDLSGVSFDVVVRSYGKREPAELTLHVFEEHNPVALRKASHTLEFGARAKLQKFNEPFRFEPIQDSRGKTYSVVLALGKDAKRAGLLCSTLKGALAVAGYRQYRNIQPVMIPYYHVAARFRKLSWDKKNSPLVSCLIVTYNSEGYVRHCLNSIARQDYANIEVVVVDNHSDDHTVDIIRGEFDHVKLVVMEQNLEFCKGNNWGSTKCQGEFICVLNADVVLEQGAIRRFVENMELSPHVAIVGSTIETKGSRTRYADTFMIDGVISNDEKLLAGKRFSSAPCGAGFMIRRSVIDELGYLFDEGFIANWEDHDLGLRCWLHGYFVLHIPELGLYHSGGSAYGLADPRRESQVFRNMLLTYFKNFGKRLFINAFLKTLTACTRPYRILGVVRFLGSFWKYIPERAALQKKRRIDDSVLQVATSGFLAMIPEDKRERKV
jgi:GT2 family glycosyltransferase/SAM-dependent methyltransferase